MTAENRKQMEAAVATALANDPRPKTDAAYEATFPTLHEWRQEWSKQSDALVKSAAEKKTETPATK